MAVPLDRFKQVKDESIGGRDALKLETVDTFMTTLHGAL